MKSKFILLFALFITAATHSAQAENRVLPLKPQIAFTPKGFDTNDNAQVILSGYFSDYCMKVGRTRHSVDTVNKKIYISPTVSLMENCGDIEVYIPYSIEVNLGPLPEGEYNVMVRDLDQKFTLMSTLPIHKPKMNNISKKTDERLYAPINTIQFKYSSQTTTSHLIVSGVYSNTCFELDHVEVLTRNGDVYEILPITKTNTSVRCEPILMPFSTTIELKDFVNRDTLIHVRSMNGQSINKVITMIDRIKGL